MVNVSDVMGGLLKAEDLKKGELLPFEIDEVEVREFTRDNGDKEKKLVIADGSKRMVLNKVNTQAIVRLLGSSETDDWTGKTVHVKRDRCQFGSKQVDCLRISDPPETILPMKAPKCDYAFCSRLTATLNELHYVKEVEGLAAMTEYPNDATREFCEGLIDERKQALENNGEA